VTVVLVPGGVVVLVVLLATPVVNIMSADMAEVPDAFDGLEAFEITWK
jgi:hypothetical protein